MKNIFGGKSIKNKIIFRSIILIISLHSVFSYIYYQDVKQTVLDSLVSKSQNLSRPLGISLSNKIRTSLNHSEKKVRNGLLELFAGSFDSDFKLLTETVEELKIMYFINPNEEIIAQSSSNQIVSENLANTPVYVENQHEYYELIDGELKVFSPYIYDSAIKGVFIYIYSDEKISQATNDALFNSFMLLVFFIFAGIAGAFFISKNMTNRLKVATDQVLSISGLLSISSSNQQIPESNDIKKIDEIDHLSINLKEMEESIVNKIGSLERQYKELKTQTQVLESGLKKETMVLEKKTSHIQDEISDIAKMMYDQYLSGETAALPVKAGKNYISLKKSKDKILIPLANLSFIQIKEHLIRFCFKDGEQWKDIELFGSLPTYEKEHSDFLFKINRSTLINPNMVKKIEFQKGQCHLLMYGETEMFVVSRGRIKEIKYLMNKSQNSNSDTEES